MNLVNSEVQTISRPVPTKKGKTKSMPENSPVYKELLFPTETSSGITKAPTGKLPPTNDPQRLKKLFLKTSLNLQKDQKSEILPKIGYFVTNLKAPTLGS